MNESVLRSHFEAATPWLKAWGKHVKRVVAAEFDSRKSVVDSDFFAVPPSCRVKDLSSFLAKARKDGKYTDPWNQITDKVGVRFVTLVSSDARLVCTFIKKYPHWTYSHDRNHNKEKRANPARFLYAAEHFVVRPKVEFQIDGITIPVEAACEIQVRTLLQHSYSELTHNTVYKGALANNPTVERRVARSMALIETTDGIFQSVAGKVASAVKSISAFHDFLETQWDSYPTLPKPTATALGKQVLDDLWVELRKYDDLRTSITQFYAREPRRIAELASAPHVEVLRQPIALLLVYLARKKPRFIESTTALTREELEELDGLTGAGLNLY